MKRELANGIPSSFLLQSPLGIERSILGQGNRVGNNYESYLFVVMRYTRKR